MGKERIISQVGDSTDGENYEDEGGGDINILSQSYRNYQVSYILKYMGNTLLQSTEVRKEYKKIKKTFTKNITPQEKQSLCTLDKNLGYGWGIVVSKYDKSKEKVLEEGASRYFEINKEKIESTCSTEHAYKQLQNDADKANYYLRQKVNIQSKFEDIYKLNKKIELYAQNQRVAIEPLFSANHQTDASLFLAKIKASKKLDKDLTKSFLYDYKFGTGSTIAQYSITKKTTQKNEILDVGTGGGLKHLITDEGSYSTIGERLKSFIDKNFIKEKALKKFLQLSLKGGIYNEVILNHDLHFVLMDQLQTDLKLIFGIEVKRNPAALLTNAMFFDLVDAEIYKIKDIDKKMPMAMEGAVSASVTIDRKVKELYVPLKLKLTSEYDYRGRIEPSKAEKLVKLDDEILQKWLKWKLKINEKIEKLDIGQLGMNSLVRDFERLSAKKTNIPNKQEKIDNNEMNISLDNCNINLKLKWDANKSGFIPDVRYIHDVKAKVFYDLILEWYGIKLPYLNKSDKIILKAAAEPKDLEDNQDEGSSKVLAIDEGKLAPETELSEYKQEDYILDKDNFDTVQHEHAFVQPLGEIVAIS